MWNLWKAVTGEWCIPGDYGTTVTVGGIEEIEVSIKELKKILEEEKKKS